MDKETFVKRAPLYYALAIGVYFETTEETSASYLTIQSYFTESFNLDLGEEDNVRLESVMLSSIAAKYLEQKSIIEIVVDDFGPQIFQCGPDFQKGWEKLKTDGENPFAKYGRLHDKAARSWLHTALDRVNEEFRTLRIQDSDLEIPDDTWEPIPLDRNDPAQEKVQEALDDTIEGLRADNGFSATLPEEKDFIAGELAEASRKLKSDVTISRGFIKRRILEPLGKIVLRFGKAALGVLAEGTKQAVIEWLKTKGIFLLDNY